MRCEGSKIKFDTVCNALDDLNITTTTDREKAALIWSDSLGELHIFSQMKPWQIINRLPSAHVLCLKGSLAYVLNEALELFPTVYGSFVPRTFAVPGFTEKVAEYQQQTGKRMLFKPDWGSLGSGIKFIENGSVPPLPGVAQEYLPSYLINNRKFDLRVYGLVSSLDPLRIHVFHDGIARFCSEDADGDSIYSYLTNVGLNQNNTSGDYSVISKLISEVFPLLEAKGINIDRLWRKIEDVIGLTVFAAHPYLLLSERDRLPNCGYSRCFQIFGFDILLDEQANPWLLEVNYRPSLEFHRPKERRMKTQMIKEAIRIACPNEHIQEILDSRAGLDQLDHSGWKELIERRNDIKEMLFRKRLAAEYTSNWSRVWPPSDGSRRSWLEIIKGIHTMPMELIPGLMKPMEKVPGGE